MITLHNALAEDWAGNGICVLLPTECVVEEEAGGLYELTMTHPITDDLRAQAVERGMLIKAPVPARETPLIQISAEGHAGQAEHEIWDTNKATKVWSKPSTGTTYPAWNDMTEYKKGQKCTYQGKNYAWNGPTEQTPTPPGGHWKRVAATSTVLKKLASGEELIYHGAHDGTWSRVTTPDGVTGYIKTADIDYLRTDPYIPARPSYQGAVPPRQVEEQLFRVYSVEVDSAETNVIVRARHISYDMTGNVIKTYVANNELPQDVLDGISGDLTNENEFQFYTNLTGRISQDYARKNLIQALLDPDFGIVPAQNAQFVRDNYDIFLLENTEIDRGVRIKYGKNLLGITVTEDQSSIVTRIIPVGKTKDGKPLLLPEYCVDSEHIYDYPTIIAKAIDFDVQVKDATDNEPEVTTEQAYELLREKAAEEFSKGCDLPDIDVSIEFVHLGDTVEYSAFHDLQQVFIYDTIRVDYAPMGIELAMQVVGYKFDAIHKRYIETRISTKTVKKRDVLAGFQLPNGGVGGTKIAYGAVSSQHLRDMSVLSAHIGNAVIGAAHIQQAAIGNAHIQDGTIENAKIADATIEGAKIKNATITDAKISSAGIDFAKIKDLLTGTSIFTQGIGDELYIGRLYVTAANIAHLEVGELVFRDDDGDLWKIGVDEHGDVTTTKVEVAFQNIAEEALLNISEYTVVKSSTEPSTGLYVGKLWLNTTTGIVYRCTAVTPSVEWEMVKAGELHTSYISAVERGLEILSSGVVEIKSGGTLSVKSMGNLKIEAGSDVDIDTQSFRIHDGDRELLSVDESGVRVGADILDAPAIIGNVMNTFPGGTIPWKGSIQASLNSIGKFLLGDSTLTVPAGTHGKFSAVGFKGARLRINFSAGANLSFSGRCFISHCDEVFLYAESVDTVYFTPLTAETDIIYVDTVKRFACDNLNLSGYAGRTSAADGTRYGIQLIYTDFTINNCCIDRTCERAVMPGNMAHGHIVNCFGGVIGGSNPASVANLGYGVRPNNGAHVSILNTTFASVSGDAAYYATLISSSPTPTGSTGTTPAAPQTRTYAASAGYWSKSNVNGGSNVSWSSGEPRQGSSRSSEDGVLYYYFGVMLYSNAANIVSDRPAGKTITSAKLTIRRNATSGPATSITCTLYMHNLTGTPSGSPNSIMSTVAADNFSVKPGEEVTVQLNSAAVSALNAGTCKGFGVKGTGGYGRYNIYGELEVTYST